MGGIKMNTVRFPNMGLSFDIDPIAFTFFPNSDHPLSIYWYGILIASAFLITSILAMRQSEKFGIKQDDIIDMILWAVPIGIIGARLYYVIFSWDIYKDDLTEIFKIWNGGLGIYGGIITGVITAIIFAKVRKIKILHLLDFAVIYIPLGQAIGRWGNFVNQEAFGTNTSLPWGMTSDTVRETLTTLQMQGINVDPALPVHPTFLYESIWDFLIFWILLFRRKNKKTDGEVIFLYMILYGFGRFFIEGLRTDSLMLGGNVRISQLLAALFVLVFSVLLIYIKRRKIEEEISVELGNSEYGNVLKIINENEAEEMLEVDSKLESEDTRDLGESNGSDEHVDDEHIDSNEHIGSSEPNTNEPIDSGVSEEEKAILETQENASEKEESISDKNKID